MTRLEELIKEQCPDGVEYVSLHTVMGYEQPTKYIVSDTHYDNSYQTPVLTAGKSFVLGYTNEDTDIYTANKENPVIIFDDFTTSFHWVEFNFKVKSSAMKILKVKNETKAVFRYLFHVMSNIQYNTVDHTRQWIEKYSKFKIPLPPEPVQRKIVQILDDFTELTVDLTAQLTTELTMRKKQYEFYRNSLLTFGEEVVCKPLGKCVIRTNNIKWSDNTNKQFQYIDLSSVDRDDNEIYRTQSINSDNAPSRAQQIILTNDVIFGTTRPMLKRYSLIPEDYNNQICSTGFCVLRADVNIVLPKWLFYNISTENFYNHIDKYQKGASYPAISDKEVKMYKLPVPSITEQQRIVDILDRFNKFYINISKALPIEIDARFKQYEYYRKKLLTFKEVRHE